MVTDSPLEKFEVPKPAGESHILPAGPAVECQASNLPQWNMADSPLVKLDVSEGF